MAGAGAAKGKRGGKPSRTGKAPAPAPFVAVRNVRPGTVLHLGDGRRIGFGEVAEVARALAGRLRRSGQARPVSR